MKTIRKYDNPFLAKIMVSKLQDSGIPAYLKDENAVIVTRVTGGLKLMVLESDEGRAKELLQQFENEFHTAVQCPNCGSHSIYLVTPEGEGSSITGIISSYFSENTSSGQDMYRCNDCEHEMHIPASDTE